MAKRYIVGIDLGTTNCALAYVDLRETGPELRIHTFEIPQLVGAGRLGKRTVLPSFLYLPGPYEEEDLGLPWDPDRNFAVGVFARDHGALLPSRLVSSAKSWLCHGGVDREARILPWGAGEEVEKVSPVEASARYLQHLKEAWNYEMARDDPDARLEKQLVVLTVPASFDEVARELTLKAAQMVGLEVVLLEEPTAALYAWLSTHENDWQNILQEGEHLLVVDVGGGTTDFTVVEVREGPGGLELERIAVGDHILLGGDNIDLALARLAERKFPKTRLDFARFQTLTFLCRELKEKLLLPEGPEEEAVRLPGRGRSLIGDALVARISREELLALVLKEFFPPVEFGAALSRVESVPRGMREWGLPFARESAITKHLGAFLYKRGIKRVDIILYNGGALKPPVFRRRLKEELTRWYGKEPRELETVSLDLAVAIGAAYYGLVKEGLGVRVGGGLPRAYYIGVEKEGVPRAVCLVPKGTKEGERLLLPRRFTVLTNRPVKFPLYTSSLREDTLGEVVEPNEDFAPLPPLTTLLRFGKKGAQREIPVQLEAYFSEIGILEIFCCSLETPHRWRLQFSLREERHSSPEEVPEGVLIKKEEASPVPIEEAKLRLARKLLQEGFEAGNEALSRIMRELEGLFEMEKDRWPLPLLRALSDFLIELKDARRKKALHESRWLNLTGFTLRPGYGEPLDPFRIRKIWGLYFEGPFHRSDRAVNLEWWIFWRRVAGGLNQGQQEQLFAKIRPVFLSPKTHKVSPQERREMLLCLANLERLKPSLKLELAHRLEKEALKKYDRFLLLALSRLLARELLYGPANCVIPATQAEPLIKNFLKTLKEKPPKEKQKRACAEALLNMCRLTGDRVRDLPEGVRKEAFEEAQKLGLPEEALEALKKVKPLATREASQLFGEKLPLGLRLAA